MKWVKRVGVAVLALILASAGIFYFTIDGLIRRGVAAQATKSLSLKTTCDSAKLSVFGQSLSLGKLVVTSPKGFSAEPMLSLNGVNVTVSVGQLRANPMHIAAITLDGPRLLIEQTKDGKFNFQVLASQKGAAPSSSDTHVIVDKLTITNATIVIRPNLPELKQEFTVNVPSIELANLGTGEGSQNGAALKDVATQVIAALAAKGMESSDVPAQLKAALQDKLQKTTDQVFGKVKDEINKNVPGGGDLLKGLPEIPGLTPPSAEPPTTSKHKRTRPATTQAAP